MSREIKCRGRRIDNGEWAAGHYLTRRTKDYGLQHMISVQDMWGFHEVDPQTVSQYTGLHDRNGKEIYEGDLWISRPHGAPYVVKWHDTGWYLFRYKTKLYDNADGLKLGEVIGNIYEHPHLLGEKGEGQG